jgi:hypothetical protein
VEWSSKQTTPGVFAGQLDQERDFDGVRQGAECREDQECRKDQECHEDQEYCELEES